MRSTERSGESGEKREDARGREKHRGERIGRNPRRVRGRETFGTVQTSKRGEVIVHAHARIPDAFWPNGMRAIDSHAGFREQTIGVFRIDGVDGRALGGYDVDDE